MPKFTITCDVTATVRETWTIEAADADEAQMLFEDAPDGQQAEFVSQEVTGDEEDREVVGIELITPTSEPAPPTACAPADGSMSKSHAAERSLMPDEANPSEKEMGLPHEYGPSRVGHGEAQCKWCFGTNRENAIIAPNYCENRTRANPKEIG